MSSSIKQGRPESPTVDVYDGQPVTQRKHSGGVLGLKVSCTLELIGEVQRCCSLQTLVHKNGELERDPLWCSQTVQMLEKRSDGSLEGLSLSAPLCIATSYNVQQTQNGFSFRSATDSDTVCQFTT